MGASYRHTDKPVNRHVYLQKRQYAKMDTFGKRIRSARKLRRMNQVELAKKAGIRQPTLSDIETGETKMLEGGTLIALSGALEVRPEWIMSGQLPMESGNFAMQNDKLLRQLIDLYGLLCDSKKHELARYANFLVSDGITTPSVSNPFPKNVNKIN